MTNRLITLPLRFGYLRPKLEEINAYLNRFDGLAGPRISIDMTDFLAMDIDREDWLQLMGYLQYLGFVEPRAYFSSSRQTHEWKTELFTAVYYRIKEDVRITLRLPGVAIDDGAITKEMVDEQG